MIEFSLKELLERVDLMKYFVLLFWLIKNNFTVQKNTYICTYIIIIIKAFFYQLGVHLWSKATRKTFDKVLQPAAYLTLTLSYLVLAS